MASPDPHARISREIQIRFYAELNDFLLPEWRQRTFSYEFHGTPSVKDTIEAIGIPHTEVDVILVDDSSVGFDHRLRGGERVAVYPVFERFDVSPITRLRRVAERAPDFVPWAWGINGFASVVSAVLATLLAVHFGFTVVIVLAILLYVAAAALRVA